MADDVVLHVDSLDWEAALATLTNCTSHTIEFAASPDASATHPNPTFTEPLHTLAGVDQFVPPEGWKSYEFNYCGNYLMEFERYRLRPGQSIRIELRRSGSAQIARFRQHYSIVGGKPDERREAMSEVVEWPVEQAREVWRFSETARRAQRRASR